MILNRKYKLAIGLSVIWFVFIGFGFWWFELRVLQAFSESVVFFDGDNMPSANAVEDITTKGQITVLHFWDPTCPCNSFNYSHLQALGEYYAEQPIAFRYLSSMNTELNKVVVPVEFDHMRTLSLKHHMDLAKQIPSSPSVAIWDDEDNLVYFGAYSVGENCDPENGFVENVLNNLLSGEVSPAINTMGVGCFCKWEVDDLNH